MSEAHKPTNVNHDDMQHLGRFIRNKHGGAEFFAVRIFKHAAALEFIRYVETACGCVTGHAPDYGRVYVGGLTLESDLFAAVLAGFSHIRLTHNVAPEEDWPAREQQRRWMYSPTPNELPTVDLNLEDFTERERAQLLAALLGRVGAT